tara:strand:+ start:90 stop:308 length:219 start_codon:yes stop_codon:yes gene_type:complete
MNIPWTEKEFKRVVGRPPEDDDLDRVNCPCHGAIGHWSCGICIHNMPMFKHCKYCEEQYKEIVTLRRVRKVT